MRYYPDLTAMPVSLAKNSIDTQKLAAIQKLAPFLIAVFSFVLYLATFRFEFVYDDAIQVLNNPMILSWHNLPLLFKTDVWRFSNPLLVGNYWRPIFMVWLLINHSLFGLNPAGWHVTSALLHAVITYFSFQLVYRLSDDATIATVSALIFAVHPCHIESVAWVSGATDSLMALFYISSLLAFIKGWNQQSGQKWIWLVVSALLFGLSVLSKETALTLPVLAIAYVVLIGKRSEDTWSATAKRVAVPLFMYGVLAVAYFIGRNLALAGVTHSRLQVGPLPLVLTWPSLSVFYLKHMVWPVGLSVFYGTTIVVQPTLMRFWLPLIGTLLLLAFLVALIVRSRSKLMAIASLLLLVPLAPAFIFPAIYPIDFAHDRYLYLPCLGFAILIGIAVRKIADRFQPHWIPIGATAVMVLILSTATLNEMVYWANDVVLFARATRIAPAYVPAYSSLGGALAARGRTKEAMFVLQQVVKADPQNQHALFNLGLGSFLDGDYGQAEQYLSRAASVNRVDGDTFALLAESRVRAGKFVEAESDIRQAIALRPYKPGYQRVLALSLEGQDKIDAALRAAEAEAKQNPEDEQTQKLVARLRAKAKVPMPDKKSLPR